MQFNVWMNAIEMITHRPRSRQVSSGVFCIYSACICVVLLYTAVLCLQFTDSTTESVQLNFRKINKPLGRKNRGKLLMELSHWRDKIAVRCLKSHPRFISTVNCWPIKINPSLIASDIYAFNFHSYHQHSQPDAFFSTTLKFSTYFRVNSRRLFLTISNHSVGFWERCILFCICAT